MSTNPPLPMEPAPKNDSPTPPPHSERRIAQWEPDGWHRRRRPRAATPPEGPRKRRERSTAIARRVTKLVGSPDPADLQAVARQVDELRARHIRTAEPNVVRAAQVLYMAEMPIAAICRVLRIPRRWLDPFLPAWNEARPSYAAAMRKDISELVRNKIEASVLSATDEHLKLGGKLRAVVGAAMAQLEAELTETDDGEPGEPIERLAKGEPIERLAKIAAALDRLAKTYKTEADVAHRMSGIGKPLPAAPGHNSGLFGPNVRPVRVIDVGPAQPVKS